METVINKTRHLQLKNCLLKGFQKLRPIYKYIGSRLQWIRLQRAADKSSKLTATLKISFRTSAQLQRAVSVIFLACRYCSCADFRTTVHNNRFYIGVFPKCFAEFAEFSGKNICHYSKRAWTCHTEIACVRDQDATTAPKRHMWETGS